MKAQTIRNLLIGSIFALGMITMGCSTKDSCSAKTITPTESSMGVGKCGTGMQGKCGAGKCGASIKAEGMKCGTGKCGSVKKAAGQ
ncbi:MAG TPA: hypothetical protein EYH01_04490 [Campylobacterales bacterium]|nr:hypothetical protein [Campylobacterales bacterium]